MTINYILNTECREPFLHKLLGVPTIVGEVDIELDYTIYGNYYPATYNFPEEYPELDDINIVSATCYTTDWDGAFTGNSFKLTENQFKYLQIYLQEKEENARVEEACWDSTDSRDDF